MLSSEEALERFATEYQVFHRITRPRRRQQLTTLRDFAASLPPDMQLHGASGPELYAWAAGELDRGLEPTTVRKMLNMIRPFYSWSYAEHLIDAEQYVKLKSVRNPRGSAYRVRPRPYSTEELEEFWAALDKRWPHAPATGPRSKAIDRWVKGYAPFTRAWRYVFRIQLDAMIALALDCGLRSHEIFALSLTDMHYDNAYLIVKGKRSGRTGQIRWREIPYPKHTREIITRWIEFRALMDPDHDRPWLTCYGPTTYCTPLSHKRFRELLRTIGPYTWHRFRHTAATNWLCAGMDPLYVQQLLGHARITMTLAYMQITPKDLAKQMRKYEQEFIEQSGRMAA